MVLPTLPRKLKKVFDKAEVRQMPVNIVLHLTCSWQTDTLGKIYGAAIYSCGSDIDVIAGTDTRARHRVGGFWGIKLPEGKSLEDYARGEIKDKTNYLDSRKIPYRVSVIDESSLQKKLGL